MAGLLIPLGISGDTACDHRRCISAVKAADTLLSYLVGLGDPLMLPQMFYPGFKHEMLKISPGLRDVLEHAPGKSAVAASFSAQSGDYCDKRCAFGRIDAVFNCGQTGNRPALTDERAVSIGGMEPAQELHFDLEVIHL